MLRPRLFRYLKTVQIHTMTSKEPCKCKENKTEPVIEAPRIEKQIIHSTKAPEAVGPYSQAIVYEKTVYVSGCLGLDKDTMTLVEGGTVAEAKQAFKSLGYILQEAGTSYANVVKTTVFLENIDDFAAVNDIYKEFFPSDFPARSCIQVAKLPKGAKVEIEAIAGIK